MGPAKEALEATADKSESRVSSSISAGMFL